MPSCRLDACWLGLQRIFPRFRRVRNQVLCQGVFENHCVKTYRFEHFQAGDCDAFRAPVAFAIVDTFVGPCSSSAGIQQYADEEEVDKSAAALCVVDAVPPAPQKLGYPVSAPYAEMLITAMAGNVLERSLVVSLYRVMSC